MATTALPQDRRLARIAIVEEHVRFENDGDLEGVLATFRRHRTIRGRSLGPICIPAGKASAPSIGSL